MWKELTIFALMYVTALALHGIPAKYARWKARREAARKAEAADAETLNAISPLYTEHDAAPNVPIHHKHWFALVVAVVSHPAAAASVKEYVVHFLIYSGHVIK